MAEQRRTKPAKALRRRMSLTIALLSIMCFSVSAAPRIKISGKWDEKVGTSDLSGGAGTDFVDHFESLEGKLSLTISKTTRGSTWTVDVRRIDTNWDTSLAITVRWISEGTGPGRILGGANDLEVTTEDQRLIYGTGDLSKIELQLRLDGVSAGVITADDYETELCYTLTEY